MKPLTKYLYVFKKPIGSMDEDTKCITNESKKEEAH